MAYVVIAKWTAQEGNEEEVAGVLAQMVEPTRAEPGNLAYVLHRDSDDPRVFLLYEQYADEEAYAAHGASEHFQRLAVGQGFDLLDSREREFYETWEAGS